ncbi:MAG: TIGR03842 family LLM class F420-dependent oxidoreductase [Actinomycetota bacterium]|nr:TIGR03842 family LLM class F420-dependent oxidoreductase [Actinomycetota bacterium]MDP2288058.1 TIGR03842 family LLM class F420-dependent oxidoreductase [Actinomycetota bacterium]
MDIGVVLQCTPPAARVIDLAKRAEAYGFGYVWTFDSHILWEEPNVIYSKILDETRKVFVGPMVTNPATRDITVTASVFATLNEMYGNRTVIGIGRGDSAVRVTNGKPVTVDHLRQAVLGIKGLVNGETIEYKGNSLRLPWAHTSRAEIWVAAYGPRMLALAGEVGDGFILQLADPSIAEWTIKAVRDAAAAAGRDPDSIYICVAAPAYVTEDIEHARDQLRWFGGMVGNHVADIVERYGEDGGAVPQALTDYIKARRGYDYNQHGQAGNEHANFVPDEIVDRFCIIGPPAEHIRRLKELQALGVDQFAVYLQHDDNDHTLAAYGEKIIPAVQEHLHAID